MVRPVPRSVPVVEELAKDYQGKLKVGKMDVDANSSTPMRYKVTGIPTLLVFKGGQVSNSSSDIVPRMRSHRRLTGTLGKGVLAPRCLLLAQSSNAR